MIKLTRINDEQFYLNADIIEQVEEKPHTLVKTTNNKTFVVKESAEEVVKLVIKYKQSSFLDRREE